MMRMNSSALAAMPIAGVLISRINPKIVITIGIALTAYSTYLMSLFNQHADFMTILWPRFFMGFGMGFTIILLFTLTLSHIKKEEMSNAMSIFNLMRNLGGSFGVAFSATLLTRRAQFHQARLVDHMTPFDTMYQWETHRAADILQMRGFEETLTTRGGLVVIYRKLLREASMLSFNDVFFFLASLTILMLPLVLAMKYLRYKAPELPESG